MYVRSLADSGPFTLRKAVAINTPKTIKFLVSGNIKLTKSLEIVQSGHTIDGSDAPRGGICIVGNGVAINAPNTTIRHIRFRPGVSAPAAADSLSLFINAQHILIENCSLSWSRDELLGSYGQFVEVRYCLLYEPLNISDHAYGPIFADDQHLSGDIDFHHNLIAMATYRCPKVTLGNGRYMRFANNIVYCKFFMTLDAKIAGQTVNQQYLDILYNHFIAGDGHVNEYEVDLSQEAQLQDHLYLLGNIGPHRATDDLDQAAIVNQAYASKWEQLAKPVRPLPKWLDTLEGMTADIFANAGATLPKRDVSDKRVIELVRNRSGVRIATEAEVGGYPDLTK